MAYVLHQKYLLLITSTFFAPEDTGMRKERGKTHTSGSSPRAGL